MRMKIKILICFLSFVCFTNTTFAQYYDEPSATKWRQIKTEHFQIVFPQKIDSIAQQYANILETAYNPVSRSLNNYYKNRVPLVLHSNDLQSNASVNFAPRQMDFMTAPLTRLYTTPWAKSLALHEFRHYVQISKYNDKGVLKFANYLFGDYASFAWANMIPNWFSEGDATLSETAMSKSGRGRMPSFFAEYRAYFLSDKNFSYDKWMHGSYKNFIPNEYAYGYVQTAYARKRFGEDVWEKTLTRTQTKSFPFFARGFRKITNTSLKELQAESFEYLKNTWIAENRQPEKDVIYITSDEKNYTKYAYPIYVDDKKIAIKEDMKRLASLVMIDENGSEKKLCDIGYYTDRIYHNNGKIYWLEDIRDVRWTAKSRNTIRFYDLKTKTIGTAKSKTRYRALGFSQSKTAETLVAAEHTSDGKNYICLLNLNDFSEIKKIPTPQNAVVASLSMRWNDIVASLISDEGASLQFYNVDENTWEVIINASPVNITNIKAFSDVVVFESGFDGVDNLYLVPVSAGEKIYRLTNSQFGATMIDVNKSDKFIYSEYYANGKRIAAKPISKAYFVEENEVDWTKPYKFELAETVAAQENFVIDTINLNNAKTYESKKYNKTANLFNVRSWLPFYAGLNPEDIVTSITDNNNDDDEKLSFGATLLSQNLLGNARSQLAYSYRNGYSAMHAGFTYTGWFPVVSIEGHYGGGKNLLVKNNTVILGKNNSFNIEATAYLPLNFSNARYSRGILPSLKFSVSNSKYFVPSDMSMKKANFAEYSISAYSYRNLAKADIFPKWGLILNFQYKNSPFDTENFGSFYGGRITTYIPGLFVNHGLRLSALYQQQDIARYVYSTIYDFPRGVDNGLSRKMTMFSTDYTFPIAYPDMNIGAFAYITRIRTNMFYDFARNQNTNTHNIYSYGIDILFDAHWLRMPYPVTLGLRTYKTNLEKNFGIKLIAGITF